MFFNINWSFMISYSSSNYNTDLPNRWKNSNTSDIQALKSGKIPSMKEFNFEEKEAASEVPIDEILPGLFLGNRYGAGKICGRSTSQVIEEKRLNLKDKKITAIICCIAESEHHFPNDFSYKDLPLDDNDDSRLLNLVDQEVVDFIDSNIEKGGVFIHCAAGMSRSASIMILYLSKKFPHLSYAQILDFLKSKRNCVEPNRHFEAILKKTIDSKIA